MAGDTRHGHARRHADEDQQRRHQESAADAEHPGNEPDREPHPEDQEDIDRKVGDRKVNLHGRNLPVSRNDESLRIPEPSDGLLPAAAKSMMRSFYAKLEATVT